MVSASIPLSTPFLCPKSTATAFPPPPPMCVRFRPSPSVSAASTTAERPTTAANRPHASQYRIATSASLYAVLGIQMDASSHEIKTAYRRLARVLHPDVASNGQKDTSAEEFMRIHTAYSTLSDPQKRTDYDRSLFRWRRPVSSPLSASGFSGYKRRTWETDQCW